MALFFFFGVKSLYDAFAKKEEVRRACVGSACARTWCAHGPAHARAHACALLQAWLLLALQGEGESELEAVEQELADLGRSKEAAGGGPALAASNGKARKGGTELENLLTMVLSPVGWRGRRACI